MTHDQVIAHYGSGDKAAAALGLRGGRATVHQWKKIGIPIEHQIAYEIDSKGALRADIPRQLRKATA
jgi:hypothetical protein